jgi:hypothetical protein
MADGPVSSRRSYFQVSKGMLIEPVKNQYDFCAITFVLAQRKTD